VARISRHERGDFRRVSVARLWQKLSPSVPRISDAHAADIAAFHAEPAGPLHDRSQQDKLELLVGRRSRVVHRPEKDVSEVVEPLAKLLLLPAVEAIWAARPAFHQLKAEVSEHVDRMWSPWGLRHGG
jgi:hypothetical protein